ncbi:MAG TPA: hypothetical protein PLX04_03800 [Caldisericia bacterium]|nr:hypothetical protein [Caldisericia bacterium]
MKKFIVIFIIALLIFPISGLGTSFATPVPLRGYIQGVELSNLKVVVDGKDVGLLPSTQVFYLNGQKASIVDLAQGQFIEAKGSVQNGSFTAGMLEIVPSTQIKQMTCYVQKNENGICSLSTGLRVSFDQGVNLDGSATPKESSVIKIIGYTKRNNIFTPYKVQKLFEDGKTYHLNGKLTIKEKEYLILEGKYFVFLEENSIFLDEEGMSTSFSSIHTGNKVRLTCECRNGLLYASHMESFDVVEVVVTPDSNMAFINRLPCHLSQKVTKSEELIMIPSLDIFRECGIKVIYNKSKNTLTTDCHGMFTTCDLQTGIVSRDGFETQHRIKPQVQNSDVILPLPIFLAMICHTDPFLYPINDDPFSILYY